MAKKQSAQTRKQKKHGARAFFKWLGLIVGTLILVGATTGAILCCYAAAYIQDVIVPQVNSSSAAMVTSGTDLSSVIYYYDQDKGDYETLQTLYAEENRVWVPYEEIPEDLIHATVAIEDKRFYTHNGVDWKRTAAAVVYMFTGQRIEGGSTITQQLIKNLTQQDQVTVRRKVLEIFEALQFDRTHTKEEIIEWYLNEIYLGRQCYGVKTAAQMYFGKDVSDLDLAECASLISITNNPSLYDPYNHPDYNLKRCKLVLEEMCKQGYIDEATRDAAKEEAESLHFTSSSDDEDSQESTGDYYSWYTDAVIEAVIQDLEEKFDYDEKTAAQLLYSGGLKIYSCMDPSVQADVDEIYSNAENVAGYDSKYGEQLQSAITVVDNETGAVVALAGGVGEKVGNRIWNKATMTVRQPGSAIKALSAYSQALESGDILPNTILEDSAFTTVNGRAWPKNSHGGYSGNVDMVYAVAQSLNTIAVKTLDKVGTQKSYNFLVDKFHISSLVDNYVSNTGKVYSDVGYSQLALGGLTKGISTYEMAAAYATFHRDGIYVPPHLYSVVVNSEGEIVLAYDGYDAEVDENGNVTITGTAVGETILSTSTCFYMTEMLEAVVTEGTGTNAAIDGMSVAGKTGTTDDDYDRWFVGYTPYYTAAVWTGYEQASQIQSGTNPACGLWQKVMSLVSQGQEDIGFGRDMATTSVKYCTVCGGIATSKSPSVRTLDFLIGDEPSYTCTCNTSSNEKKSNKKEETKKEEEQEEEKQEEEQEEQEQEEKQETAENPSSEPSAKPETTKPETTTPAAPTETTPPETETPAEQPQPSEPDDDGDENSNDREEAKTEGDSEAD